MFVQAKEPDDLYQNHLVMFLFFFFDFCSAPLSRFSAYVNVILELISLWTLYIRVLCTSMWFIEDILDYRFFRGEMSVFVRLGRPIFNPVDYFHSYECSQGRRNEESLYCYVSYEMTAAAYIISIFCINHFYNRTASHKRPLTMHKH